MSRHVPAVLASAVLIAGCQRFLEFQAVHVDDATVDTDSADSPADLSLHLIAQKYEHAGAGTMAMTFSMTIPDAARTVLLVNVGLSSDVVMATKPTIATISYAGMPLTLIDSIVGVPTQPDTRTELWQLVAPPSGSYVLDIEMSSPGNTIHAGALVYANVDQTRPIRTSQPASGQDTVAVATITSMPGDKVVGFVGAGAAITGVMGADSLYTDDASVGYSLDNSAAAETPGAASVSVMWNLASYDLYQVMLLSLAP